LCKRCGLCCLEKIVEPDGSIRVTDRPCRFLDVAERRCKIYEHRFEACPDCLPVTEHNLTELVWLPESCGYVEYFNRLHGSKSWRQAGAVIWPEGS